MFDIARLIGDALREVKSRDGIYLQQNNIDSHANFVVGGQVRGEPPRLFEVYSEGNFIEATPDTCYFHQVRPGVVRLHDALEHIGRASDRPRGV